MPMIDAYAVAGTFVDKNKLAQDMANAVMKWEGVPSTDLFKKNTAAFVHELPSDAISNAAGDNNYVRVQVLTPVNVLNTGEQDLGTHHGISGWWLGDQRPSVHERRHCRLRPCGAGKFARNEGFLKRTLAPHCPEEKP